MASSPSPADKIREHREKITDGGEPLNSESRVVLSINGGLYINATDYAKKTHDISKGDTVEVHTTADGLKITFVDDGDDDGRR